MKVLHVVPSVAAIYGGPSLAVRRMTQALTRLGVQVDVATTTAHGRAEVAVPRDRPVLEDGVRYFYNPRQWPKFWTFSWPLTQWLRRHADAYDVLHVHALFSYPTLPACRAARRHSVPYVLSPHGTLDPWSLRVRAWKKAPYLWVLERRNLLGAGAVHATSTREQRAINGLGFPVRVVTIPLGVDAYGVGESNGVLPRSQAQVATVNVLFLSRLHPKKGIELLLTAVRLLAQQHRIRLLIAGDGDAAYVKNLRRLVGTSGLQNRVIFTGFVTGAEKQALFERADLFALPSYDENFGMAVAEAMSVGLPVVVSEHVALADHVREAGAGLVVPCDAGELAQGIAMLVKDSGLRHRMGQAGRRLAETEFAWPEVARRLLTLYEQLMAPSAGQDVGR
jgi:glycosyltransferase involved in cell wall biosynthesis